MDKYSLFVNNLLTAIILLQNQYIALFISIIILFNFINNQLIEMSN